MVFAEAERIGLTQMTAPALAVKPSASVIDLLAMIQAMAPDTRRLLNEVAWEEYQQLRAALPESAKVRLAFHEGTLEIMTLGYTHERYKEFLVRLVSLIAHTLEIDLESAGSTTLSVEELKDGAEPDTAFYITHASVMVGRDAIDLAIDPPPDIIVEVDISYSSWKKRNIYANFRVPELWHLVHTNLTIYALQGSTYHEQETSVSFPFLSAQTITHFLEESVSIGQAKALRKFDQWLATALPLS
jgi:Uma2 family endonuclease